MYGDNLPSFKSFGSREIGTATVTISPYVTHASNKIGYTYLPFTNDISFSLQMCLTRIHWRTKMKTLHKADQPNVNTWLKCQIKCIQNIHKMYTVMNKIFLSVDHFVGAISRPWRKQEKRSMDCKIQQEPWRAGATIRKRCGFRPRFALWNHITHSEIPFPLWDRVLLLEVVSFSQSMRFPLRDSIVLSEAAFCCLRPHFAIAVRVSLSEIAFCSRRLHFALRGRVLFQEPAFRSQSLHFSLGRSVLLSEAAFCSHRPHFAITDLVLHSDVALWSLRPHFRLLRPRYHLWGHNSVSEAAFPSLRPRFHLWGRVSISEAAFPSLRPRFHLWGRVSVSEAAFPSLRPRYRLWGRVSISEPRFRLRGCVSISEATFRSLRPRFRPSGHVSLSHTAFSSHMPRFALWDRSTAFWDNIWLASCSHRLHVSHVFRSSAGWSGFKFPINVKFPFGRSERHVAQWWSRSRMRCLRGCGKLHLQVIPKLRRQVSRQIPPQVRRQVSRQVHPRMSRQVLRHWLCRHRRSVCRQSVWRKQDVSDQ